MLTLPFELIAQIFSICVHENDIPPWSLSSVNRHLRRIALKVPELWNHIDYTDTRDRSRMILHLDRSGTAGLSVELTLPHLAFCDSSQTTWLITTLTPHLNRIRSLQIITIEGLETVPHLSSEMIWMAMTAERHLLKLLAHGISASSPLLNCRHFRMVLSNVYDISMPSLPASLRSIDMLENLVIPASLANAILSLPHLEVLKLRLGRFDSISRIGNFLASLVPYLVFAIWNSFSRINALLLD